MSMTFSGTNNRVRLVLLAIAVASIAGVRALPVAAQDVRVQATVNSTTVGTEERVAFTIEIEGADLQQVRLPEPPSAVNLQLEQSVPSTSRNVSIVNGAMSQSVSYRWTYRPVAQGEARIESATVQIGDRTLRTDPIRLAVVPQSQRPQQPPTAQRQPGWPFSRQQRTPSQDQPQDISGEDLFIRAVPSKRQAYVNEQVVVEYHLYGRDYIQLRQSRLADSWDAEGFWREDLDVDTRPIPRSVVENGLRYNVIVLKRVAAFPTRAGRLRLEPLRIETEVYLPGRSRDPFASFFSGNFQPVELSSPAVTIEVRPLPPGAPEGFQGAVGSFRLDASTDQSQVEVGQSVQVRMHVSGTGNIATLAPPPFEPPGVFERYDPQINTSIDRSGRRLSGSKTITHLLVPRSNGRFELPEARLVFFDPERERYERVSVALGALEISGRAGPIAASATRAGMPVDDIAGLKTGEVRWQRRNPPPLHTRPLPYAAVGLPLLALGAGAVYQRRNARLASDRTYARNRRAHPLARKHLRTAESLLQKNDARAFYAEIERALLAFVGNRLDVPEVGLTRSQLDAHLRARDVSDATRRDLYGLLDEAEQAQFAPVPPDRHAMETAIERAGRTIVSVNEDARRPSGAIA